MIGIVDYGIGNLRSVRNALAHHGGVTGDSRERHFTWSRIPTVHRGIPWECELCKIIPAGKFMNGSWLHHARALTVQGTGQNMMASG